MKKPASTVAVRKAEAGRAVMGLVAFPATPVARYWSSGNAGPSCFMHGEFL